MRNHERRVLRKVGEHALKAFFNRIGVRMSRADRRISGRIYGNAAYREWKGLETAHGYQAFVPHPDMVAFVVKEGRHYLEQAIEETPSTEAASGEGSGEAIPEADGIGEHSVPAVE